MSGTVLYTNAYKQLIKTINQNLGKTVYSVKYDIVHRDFYPFRPDAQEPLDIGHYQCDQMLKSLH